MLNCSQLNSICVVIMQQLDVLRRFGVLVWEYLDGAFGGNLGMDSPITYSGWAIDDVHRSVFRVSVVHATSVDVYTIIRYEVYAFLIMYPIHNLLYH
jgi:hypothetical protein